jgi:hypothetical protein
MEIWLAMLVDFEGRTTYTANLTVEDLGNGHAKGTVRDLSGPVPVDEIDLSGVVMNNTYVLGGSVAELGINLSLTFEPYVFAYAGSARIVVHGSKQALNLFVLTQGTE